MISVKKKGFSISRNTFNLVLFLALFLNSCVEPFEPQTVTFESALVIESTLTNELRTQQVNLSRAFAFESDGPTPEQGANVVVVDESGNEQVFQESQPGIYLSTNTFSAQNGVGYQLRITTRDGRSYASDMTELTATTQIDNLYAERITNDDGDEGIGIFVDSFDSNGASKNYRYEYEESYKIIAPTYWVEDLEPDPEGGCGLITVLKNTNERTCFATDLSNTIIIANTNGFVEDRVDRFRVRFIDRNNYIISHRYSILVRQYVQSNEAYNFFETLSDFSRSESLFSETQPGFLSGNIFSVDNSNEKVLGYFDVASVSEQRIFFDYSDYFPNEDLPPFPIDCTENAPALTSMGGGCILLPMVVSNLVKFSNYNESPAVGEGPFFVVPRECGDCTALGETKVPDFWIE